jgi:hypothetical protein
LPAHNPWLRTTLEPEDSVRMFSQIFRLAATSPGRQLAFRKAVAAHVLVLLVCVWIVQARPGGGVLIGQILLTLGICEGALLLGWRLTQFPKNLGLEFLLVTPEPAWRLYLAECLTSILRLALVTLSGLPVFVLLLRNGYMEGVDLAVLLVVPLLSGSVVGLGLTWWVYEPAQYRRIGERCVLAMVVLYLAVGVLAGEQLRTWLTLLPEPLALVIMNGFEAVHRYNAFSILQYWMEESPSQAWPRLAALLSCSMLAVACLLARSAFRFTGHFHELHYRPARRKKERGEARVGSHPLSWWAVRRVTAYSGRVNIWLATGISVLYAAYLVAGSHWPAWLGRSVFELFDRFGGVPTLTTILVVLAAVPAAFQYGLWDSNSQERCRKLELLLLTRLTGHDFWRASAAAAWTRGRSYFFSAMLLWTAAAIARPALLLPCIAALAAGILLWGLYFALGFRAFTRGTSGSNLGLLLTLGLPVIAYGLFRQLGPAYTALVPPGAVYVASSGGQYLMLALGATSTTLASLYVSRRAIAGCLGSLAAWYELRHGNIVVE